MAIDRSDDSNLNLDGCRWDPIDPHSCFDETSCGCYVSPCDYFNIQDVDCGWDTSELCCIQVNTC